MKKPQFCAIRRTKIIVASFCWLPLLVILQGLLRFGSDALVLEQMLGAFLYFGFMGFVPVVVAVALWKAFINREKVTRRICWVLGQRDLRLSSRSREYLILEAIMKALSRSSGS